MWHTRGVLAICPAHSLGIYSKKVMQVHYIQAIFIIIKNNYFLLIAVTRTSDRAKIRAVWTKAHSNLSLDLSGQSD